MARIALLVQEASQTKARVPLFIDKVEQRYSSSMIVWTNWADDWPRRAHQLVR